MIANGKKCGELGRNINKYIKNSRRSSYHLPLSLNYWQQDPKHFELYFFLYEIYGFSYINKGIFLHVVSSFLLFIFSSSLQKKSFLNSILSYDENKFCRLSFMLPNVSLTQALKYKNKIETFWELRSIKEC